MRSLGKVLCIQDKQEEMRELEVGAGLAADV